jgi:histidine ammonia-lyase
MMITKVSRWQKVFSGVTVINDRTHHLAYKKRCDTVVPEKGSVGASGDLAPLAHFVFAIDGLENVFIKGERKDTAIGVKDAGVKPIQLGRKKGLLLSTEHNSFCHLL